MWEEIAKENLEKLMNDPEIYEDSSDEEIQKKRNQEDSDSSDNSNESNGSH